MIEFIGYLCFLAGVVMITAWLAVVAWIVLDLGKAARAFFRQWRERREARDHFRSYTRSDYERRRAILTRILK
jgi:hypothetical protein